MLHGELGCVVVYGQCILTPLTGTSADAQFLVRSVVDTVDAEVKDDHPSTRVDCFTACVRYRIGFDSKVVYHTLSHLPAAVFDGMLKLRLWSKGRDFLPAAMKK